MMDLPSYSFLVLFVFLATSGFERGIVSRAQDVEENSRRLATANNHLAVNIYRQLVKDFNGNVFFSPLSLSTAFGMLYYGARGDTAEELRTALGYESAGLGEVHQTFQNYLNGTLPSQDTTAYTLKSANAVLLEDDLDVVPGYKTGVRDYYQATVEEVDFATQGPHIVSQINEWVREKTNGKIEEILTQLDPTTILVLMNAVYFKGAWKKEFDPTETDSSNFYNYGLRSSETEIHMMYAKEKFPYAETGDVKVLEMPYKGDNISMVLLLPTQLDGLESVEGSLTPTKLSELRGQLVKKEVHVAVPKFKLEYYKELSRDFQSAGANKIFGPEADFSGLTSSSVSVSEVHHKAVIEVNEEGSEAAGVTVIISNRILDFTTPYFTVDRPFLFAIVDRRNDMILFLGRVTNL